MHVLKRFCAHIIYSSFSELQEISGLQNCLQLKKLYLYDNEICEIKNLELQINVEVLWLSSNCITQIQVWRSILLAHKN